MSQFQEVRACKYCSGLTHENTRMEHSYCTECGMIEPDEKTMYECQDCWELKKEEKCDCNVSNGLPLE